MEKIIEKNLELVKQILSDVEISEKAISNMAKIYPLRNDFEEIHFIQDRRKLWWEAEISLRKRINSHIEFLEYLKRNNISLEGNKMGGYGNEIYRPDYILIMDYGKGIESELRCNFYNPDKPKHRTITL